MTEAEKAASLPKKSPDRALAYAIIGVSDYVEATGGDAEERIEAVEKLLKSISNNGVVVG